jgi:Fic family protein
MTFQDKLSVINQLQTFIQQHGKLPDEVLKKINYKFRLDWNYYSNSMEGNSLTRQETRSVMVGNITVEGKPLQDVLEMKRHDDVISTIIKMGKGELNISEKRIKEIHAGIMYEEDPDRIKQIGQWKKQPNYLYNYKKERFDFVSPEEVPERIHKLVDWLNASKEKIQRRDKDALHPVFLAFKFHLDYITIHPFYDGNGRTSRILSNLILISFGYPPMYIKTDERNIYYQYLADIQGYGGEPDLFYDFMSGLLIRSQEIVLAAIEGGNIDEPEDLDKRLYLIEKELESFDSENDIKVHLNKEVFIGIYDTWLKELLKKGITLVQKFNHLFKGVNHHIAVHAAVGISFADESAENVLDLFSKDIMRNIDRLNTHEIVVSLRTNYGTFKKGGLNTFGCNYGFEIKFDKIKYEISVDQFSEANVTQPTKILPEKLLHKPLTETQMNVVVSSLGEAIISHIEYHTKKLRLN